MCSEMIPETWLTLSHSSLSFSLSFPLYTCVTAKTLTQMRGTALTPSTGSQPASCPALMLTRLTNCSSPCQAPPCAPVRALPAGSALPSLLRQVKCHLTPQTLPHWPWRKQGRLQQGSENQKLPSFQKFLSKSFQSGPLGRSVGILL